MPFKMYPDEARFYNAVAEYIRDGYKMVERLADPTHRRAAGFLLTTFQKLNASSTAAIRSALDEETRAVARRTCRSARSATDEEDLFFDERYEGEQEEQDVLLDDRQIREDEIRNAATACSISGKGRQEADQALGIGRSDRNREPARTEEKVLIFTEYRETQHHLVRRA